MAKAMKTYKVTAVITKTEHIRGESSSVARVRFGAKLGALAFWDISDIECEEIDDKSDDACGD